MASLLISLGIAGAFAGGGYYGTHLYTQRKRRKQAAEALRDRSE